MRHGDISNQGLPVICFDAEGFLVERSSFTKYDQWNKKLIKMNKSKPVFKIEPDAAAVCRAVFEREVAVHILTKVSEIDDPTFFNDLEESLEDVFFTKLVSVTTRPIFKKILRFDKPEAVYTNLYGGIQGIQNYKDHYDLSMKLAHRFNIRVKQR